MWVHEPLPELPPLPSDSTEWNLFEDKDLVLTNIPVPDITDMQLAQAWLDTSLVTSLSNERDITSKLETLQDDIKIQEITKANIDRIPPFFLQQLGAALVTVKDEDHRYRLMKGLIAGGIPLWQQYRATVSPMNDKCSVEEGVLMFDTFLDFIRNTQPRYDGRWLTGFTRREFRTPEDVISSFGRETGFSFLGWMKLRESIQPDTIGEAIEWIQRLAGMHMESILQARSPR